MTTVREAPTSIGVARRWSMLGASTFAQAASAVIAHGPAFLIPTLHTRLGYTLAEAGLVAAAPTVGVMLTLVGWGVVVDRRGERFVLLAGLSGAAAATAVAALLRDDVVLVALALLVAGGFSASSNSASGRVVVGWFPPERRGLAMGIRQMAQPLGVGVGAIGIAVLADRYGVSAALWLPAGLAVVAVAVVAWVVLDPPRPERTVGSAPNPYRADRYLARIHGVSVLLVVPQFLVWTFALVWLVQDRGWSPGAAGTVVALAQIVGAFGRIAVGQLSDMVGSRMRVLLWVSGAAVLSMLGLGLTSGLGWGVSVVVMVIATGVTVADNGLSFTAVAERAGPFWSGRALGIQNTAQFLAASAVPPVAGLAVTQWGYSAAFATAAVFPLVALGLVPVRDEGRLQ